MKVKYETDLDLSNVEMFVKKIIKLTILPESQFVACRLFKDLDGDLGVVDRGGGRRCRGVGCAGPESR
jgi:hypothetical protein